MKTQITITPDRSLLTQIWSSDYANEHAGKTYMATINKSGWAEIEGAQFPTEAFSLSGQKLTNPEIRISNHVGQIRARSFPEAGGLTTAHIAYKEGAEVMALMFREAIKSGDLKRVMDLAKATEQTSFYEY